MQISLNIVLDALRQYRHESHVAPGDQVSFSKCMPLPDTPQRLDPACVYIGSLSKTLHVRGHRSDAVCICLRDRVRDEMEDAGRISGLVIVNENIPLAEIFSLVQNRFFLILDWVRGMHETLIRGGTMQDVLELSAPVIGNHIAVSDSAFRLMAYTAQVPCDDPISIGLIEGGYHTEESIRRFKKYDLFKVWETANATFTDETCQVAKYVTVHKIFHFADTYFAHVVMSCNNHPLTPCLLDLFAILTDILSIFIERAWETRTTSNHIYDSFLADLLSDTVPDRAAMEARAQSVGFPVSGPFSLFQITCKNAANVSLGKMLTEFSEIFPRLKFIRHHQKIVALCHHQGRDIRAQLDALCPQLEGFLLRHDALCGVSPVFGALDEVRPASQQAALTLSCAARLRGSGICRNMPPACYEETRIFFFEDYYAFLILGGDEDAAAFWYHSEGHRLLHRLHRYDLRHKSSYIQLLHAYLTCERNATAAAAILNMHRNNVTYHIGRIQEFAGLQLDDPAVRYRLLASFYLLELHGFSPG